MSYFYAFGECKRCRWPSHFRHDRPARKKRLWRKARPAQSWVSCANCGKTTLLGEGA